MSGSALPPMSWRLRLEHKAYEANNGICSLRYFKRMMNRLGLEVYTRDGTLTTYIEKFFTNFAKMQSHNRQTLQGKFEFSYCSNSLEFTEIIGKYDYEPFPGMNGFHSHYEYDFVFRCNSRIVVGVYYFAGLAAHKFALKNVSN